MLLHRHPSSGILGEALLRLVHTALQAKPIRQALLSPASPASSTSAPASASASLQAIVAAALSRPPVTPALASRPIWFGLATSLDDAGRADKQAKASLNLEPSWVELAAELPRMRERMTSPWQCAPVPARPSGGIKGGEMQELLQALQMGELKING